MSPPEAIWTNRWMMDCADVFYLSFLFCLSYLFYFILRLEMQCPGKLFLANVRENACAHPNVRGTVRGQLLGLRTLNVSVRGHFLGMRTLSVYGCCTPARRRLDRVPHPVPHRGNPAPAILFCRHQGSLTSNLLLTRGREYPRCAFPHPGKQTSHFGGKM